MAKLSFPKFLTPIIQTSYIIIRSTSKLTVRHNPEIDSFTPVKHQLLHISKTGHHGTGRRGLRTESHLEGPDQAESMARLSTTFRSIKNPRPPPEKTPAASEEETGASSGTAKRRRRSKWSVYLIISSRLPKTYVGVTTNFSRRLKEHNGVLKGGAKASSAGRPWVLACLVQGFKDRSEACTFESKWKNTSRKMSRKKKTDEDSSKLLLQHREAALFKVKASLDCSYLQIEWHFDIS